MSIHNIFNELIKKDGKIYSPTLSHSQLYLTPSTNNFLWCLKIEWNFLVPKSKSNAIRIDRWWCGGSYSAYVHSTG